jgi:hypothetical protein
MRITKISFAVAAVLSICAATLAIAEPSPESAKSVPKPVPPVTQACDPAVYQTCLVEVGIVSVCKAVSGCQKEVN